MHGNTYEKTAIHHLARELNTVIMDCGIYIDKEYCYMAASPDGVFDEDEIIEIKDKRQSAYGTICVKEAVDAKKN